MVTNARRHGFQYPSITMLKEKAVSSVQVSTVDSMDTCNTFTPE